MSNSSADRLQQLGMRMQRGLSPSERAAMVSDAIEMAYEIAQAEAPDRTGALKRDMDRRVEVAGERGKVFHTSAVANYVNEGTKAHVIRAKNAKFLAFKIGGRTIYRKSVRHPGTKANPYFQRAATKAEQRLETKMLPYLERMLIEVIKP